MLAAEACLVQDSRPRANSVAKGLGFRVLELEVGKSM